LDKFYAIIDKTAVMYLKMVAVVLNHHRFGYITAVFSIIA
jgi:hypothetical protein